MLRAPLKARVEEQVVERRPTSQDLLTGKG